MSFEEVLKELKQGKRVTRKSWNNEWIVLVKASVVPYRKIGRITPLPWIGKRLTNAEFAVYTISYDDLLANDWQVVELL